MWNKFKYAMQRFMYGRYGVDELNIFLMAAAFLLAICNRIFWGSPILAVIALILLCWEVFRLYSRNIYKRRKENDAFLRFFSPFRKRAKLVKKQAQDKEHKYFICPSCSQNVRVPKGRGKIVITCPRCAHKFERKS